MTPPYPKVHVIINPASGPNRPILNTLNDVFRKHGVDWDVSITKRYGDATQQAKDAIARGVDLVVGYGGDGTQHELANAVIGTGMPMGILPGGTGNGFAREIGIPKELDEAVELLCTSQHVQQVDAVLVGTEYFIQRLYAGIPPESQTSRDLKERYGLLAYAITLPKQVLGATESEYRLTIDGRTTNVSGIKCYIVNSGKTGTGLSIDVDFSASDGFLDVFVVSRKPLSIMSAEARFFKLPTWSAGLYYWRGPRDHHRGGAGAGDLDGRRVSRQQPGDGEDQTWRAGGRRALAFERTRIGSCSRTRQNYQQWRIGQMKVVIVGGVAGGASCAARLRRLDETAEILMVERGPYVSYANCGLPYHVGGVIPRASRACWWRMNGCSASNSRSMCAPAARRSRSRRRRKPWICATS